MTDDDRFARTSKEVGKAVASLVFSPAIGVARIVGAALGQPGLEGRAIAVLQEDVVRFFALLQTHLARLDEEIRSKIDGVELAEVILQSTTNMGRTASTEKRRLMQNVAINGLGVVGDQIVERRLFVQAVIDLDLSHIDFLRAADDADGFIDSPVGELTPAIVQPLVARGFVAEFHSSAGFAFDSPNRIPTVRTYASTGLGRRFLAFLAEPVE